MIADILLVNGKYFSPENGSPRRGGLAVAGERIVARGPDRALAELRGPATQVIDLGGRLVTPGFNDAHIHFSEGGLSLLEVDCRGARSAEELAERAAARAAERGPGAWVTGRGWDHHLFPGGRLPDRRALDRACPQNPALLRRVCGHAALANAAALAAAGIGRETRDPPGGRIGRDAHGEPDGLLFETAIELVRAKQPPPGPGEREEGLRRVLARAREVGLTSIQDEKGWLETYRALEARGELTVRASVWNRLTAPLDELRAWRDGFDPFSASVRPGLLKGYLDGSLGARTALFFEPYADDPTTCGMAVMDAETARSLVVAADAEGFQVGLHAIGDRAVALALDCFEAAREKNGARDARHRVEHAQNVRPADVERFARLEAVASMQPSHCAADSGFAAARLGGGRLAEAYPWRALLAAGARVAFGSDFPIESLDPRKGLYAALTRLGWEGAGEPLGGAAARLGMAEAIDLFTRGAAHAEFREEEKGTLEPGMLADLVVFGADLFAIAPREVLEAPIDLTMVGGRVVYERGGA
jgi:predicted amidohydrolase YtcJ